MVVSKGMTTYRAIIVEIQTTELPKTNLEEIKSLAETSGAKIIEVFSQNLKQLNPATCIGKGKVEEIKAFVEKENIDAVIFDMELSPSQESNLEEELEVDIIDRTGLIIEIFAQRARTKEGKIQVDLAQLTYMLSRLKGKGIDMSRLGGGIGTRGPGEMKLETDRRTIKDKIIKLKQELKMIEKSRDLHRKYREKKNIPQIAIAGYTNAGKSTLLNLLTASDAFVEDKLFATLDPTTRRLKLSNGKQAIITDTVGFIQRLPHHLVDAFKSTFEEIKEADLILHVIDISTTEFNNQTNIVKDVLKEMNAEHVPVLYVYNKIDAAEIPKETFLRYPKQRPFIMMSALKGIGQDELLKKIEELLSFFWEKLSLKIGHVDSWILSFLLSNGYIISQEEKDDYTLIEVELPRPLAGKLKKSLKPGQLL